MKYKTLGELFTAIADKIRTSAGTADVIVADDFPDKIDEVYTAGKEEAYAERPRFVTGTVEPFSIYKLVLKMQIDFTPSVILICCSIPGSRVNTSVFPGERLSGRKWISGLTFENGSAFAGIETLVVSVSESGAGVRLYGGVTTFLEPPQITRDTTANEVTYIFEGVQASDNEIIFDDDATYTYFAYE